MHPLLQVQGKNRTTKAMHYFPVTSASRYHRNNQTTTTTIQQQLAQS